MQEPIRNRIKGHRRVRAGDLIPHELNFRLHPDLQKSALESLYQHIGFARSLLAYELPDGRLKLVDGHLRRDIDPNMEVEVEILDVNDEEARTLLLSIDPLAALAETQQALHYRLTELAPTPPPELLAAWQTKTEAAMAKFHRPNGLGDSEKAIQLSEQFLVLITCRKSIRWSCWPGFRGRGWSARRWWGEVNFRGYGNLRISLMALTARALIISKGTEVPKFSNRLLTLLHTASSRIESKKSCPCQVNHCGTQGSPGAKAQRFCPTINPPSCNIRT